MSFCPNCGANVGDSLFCGFCGTKITYNEKAINSTSQTDKTEQNEEIRCDGAVCRNPVEYKPGTNNILEQVVEAQPKPQPEKNIQSEMDICSFEKKPHPQEFEATYSSSLPLKEKNQNITEDISAQASDIKKQEEEAFIEEKSTPKMRKKKMMRIILSILISAVVIVSSVAIGFYVKPKADIYVIANAVAKTVFQSGSFNFNLDGSFSDDGEIVRNYNGCVIWGDCIKNSYLCINLGDDKELDSIVKYENGYWKQSYDGYEFDTICRGLPTFMAINIPTEKFESTSIDEDGFESFVDYAVIPFINNEFTEYWNSSLNSLTAKQAIEILTGMLLDKDFNQNAIIINKKDKADDGTKYSLTVDIDSLIKACWNYLKTTDIYTVMLDNSKNREEFDRKMNDYFDNEVMFDLILKLDFIIDNDGYIDALTCRTGYNSNDDIEYDDIEYNAEIYNFGMAEKQG